MGRRSTREGMKHRKAHRKVCFLVTAESQQNLAVPDEIICSQIHKAMWCTTLASTVPGTQ